MMSTATATNTCVFIAKEEEKNPALVDAEEKKNLVVDDNNNKLKDPVITSEVVEIDAKMDSTLKSDSELSLKPQLSLKEQLVTDKDEANFKVNKEQLLGSVTESTAKEVEVKVLNLTVQSPGRADNIVTTPFRPSTAKATLFTLKEGCKQQIKFEFVVSNNAVSGLKYIGEVWKKGIKVDVTKKAVGNFSAREEAYKFELPEATTPSGFFARGSFAARTRFVDEDGKCHFDATYYFDIQKNWATS